MENLIREIFIDLQRPKPGKSLPFVKAANLLTEIPTNPEILEIGCGYDFHSLDLAYLFGGHIYSVNNRDEYLVEIKSQAFKYGYGDIIDCMRTDICHFEFPERMFNVIWTEEGIHSMDISHGITNWKKFLKHYGYIAINEVSWLRNNQPIELKEFWQREYPGMNYVENNLQEIQSSGYKIVDYFVISPDTWWDEYYAPLDKRIRHLRYKYFEDEIALEIIDYIQCEINLFMEYSGYYGNVYYVMQTTD